PDTITDLLDEMTRVTRRLRRTPALLRAFIVGSECGSPRCGAWVRRAPASVGYGRLLADSYDAGPSRAGRSAARARHHDVTDGSAAARGSTADAVHTLGETAVAPRRAGGILGAVRAAGAVGGAAVAAIRAEGRLPPLLAERSLRRSRLTPAGLAGIRHGPEESVARARIAIIAVTRSRDPDAPGSELRAAHRDHGAVIPRGALIPVVAGGIGVQRTGDAFAALA